MTTDRPQRYLTRLDAHLAPQPPSYREAFLRAQLAHWETLYAQFISAVSRDIDAPLSPNAPAASDFVMTIAGIGARLTAHTQSQEERNVA